MKNQQNPLANLQDLKVQSLHYTQILDFARYTIRMDPTAKRGWFRFGDRQESDIEIRRDTNARKTTLYTTAPELPPQIRLALERGGYTIDTVRCAT